MALPVCAVLSLAAGAAALGEATTAGTLLLASATAGVVSTVPQTAASDSNTAKNGVGKRVEA